MSKGLSHVMSFEVPIIVLLGEKPMSVSDVLALVPGSIIELPKSADEPLELCVNNKTVGTGAAVKVGENFGIKISFVGDAQARLAAMAAPAVGPDADSEFAALADQLLAGQI